MSELSSKLFFRIGEVAGLVGVEPHVLRYWEREFRSIRPTKSAKGQRVYSRKDVENLLRVRDLLYRDGFTIAGAKKRLQRGGVEPPMEALPSGLPFGEDLAPSTPPESAAAPVVAASATLATRSVEPASIGVVVPSPVEARLRSLRAEVEGFLAELTSTATADSPEHGLAAGASGHD